MDIIIACIGHMKPSPELDLLSKYIKQTRWNVVVREFEDKKTGSAEERKKREGALLLSAVPAAAKIVVMDERGKQLCSEKFAKRLGGWQDESVPAVVFLIGGADGLEQNQNIKIKRLELEAIKNDIKIANRLQNPQIQSNVVIGNVALGNCSQAGVSLPVEILKRGIRKKIAIEKYNIKETELKQFEHNFKLQVMQAYFDVLYAKSVYKIQEDRLKLFEAMVDITTKRKIHSSYEIDNLKADIQFATQKIEVNRAHANMLAKQFDLNKVLNVDKEDVMYDTQEASLFDEDWKFLKFSIPDYDFLERTALKYSYMIKLSELDVLKSEEELKAAKHQRIPDMSIAGGYAWQAHRNATVNYGGAFVGAGLDLPILYNFTPDIQKANLFLQRSRADKKAYEHQLKYELKKDYNIFKYSAENMEYSRKILADSNKIVELSTKRYVDAKNNYSDFIINANSHQEILKQYLDAMSRHFYSYLELMQDIGHDILIEEEVL